MIVGFDFMSPWFMACIMFLISSVFLFINGDNWGYDISPLTIIVIISGLIVFGFAEVLMRKLFSKNKNKSDYSVSGERFLRIQISTKLVLIISAFMSCVTFFYYKQVLNMAIVAGYSSTNSLPMLRYARIATLSNSNIEIDTNPLIGLGIIISYAIAHVFIYAFLYNRMLSEFKKRDLFYLLPISMYIIQIILSAGRTQFLYLALSIFVIYFIFQKERYYKIDKKRKSKTKLYFFILIVPVLFYLLGNFTGKSDKYSFFETVSIYLGSSLVGLDYFINNMTSFYNDHRAIGGNTFIGIYELLNKLNITNFDLKKEAPFFNFFNYESNIYTSYMRLILDFSYIGFYSFQFFFGLLISYFYLKISTFRYFGVTLIIYSLLIQVVFEIAIEERFFMNFISLGYFLRIVFLIIIFKLLIKNDKTNKIRVEKTA